MAALLVAPALLVQASAQSRLDSGVAARIREEAHERSQVLKTVQVLTDRYGPRLTGSPNLDAAGQWAVDTMAGWGMTNGRLEPWDFGHPGWTNERLAVHLVSPVKDPLVAEVLAWTPGTNGVVRAEAVLLGLPTRPTEAELEAHLDSNAGRVQNRIVFVGSGMPAPVTLTPPPTRRLDDEVRSQFDPTRPRSRQRGVRPADTGLSASEVERRVARFLKSNGALVRVNDGRRENGQIVAFHNSTYDVNAVVPTIVMRNEDFGRVARLVSSGTAVELEVDIVNQTHPEGRTAHNAIAEIEGSDLRHEVVMIGGHLDAWHSATGATDNAVGCAIMMEAARILKALNLQPRRTIRVALWSGEEQGLLGSRAYVAKHFGTSESPTEFFRFLTAYLNVDNGTGRLRGATVFGPATAGNRLRDMIKPLADLGLIGAISTENRSLGSSDNSSFNAAGLPGIGFSQDPIQYETHTHHTNLDTYERILESDVKASVTVIATLAYELATRDERLPQFAATQMPAPPGGR
ncbi:MAG: M20/M25/M40 family metallo-hydrolase [Vicinamibacterales bacterium]